MYATFVLLILSFVWWRCRYRCRRGLTPKLEQLRPFNFIWESPQGTLICTPRETTLWDLLKGIEGQNDIFDKNAASVVLKNVVSYNWEALKSNSEILYSILYIIVTSFDLVFCSFAQCFVSFSAEFLVKERLLAVYCQSIALSKFESIQELRSSR